MIIDFENKKQEQELFEEISQPTEQVDEENIFEEQENIFEEERETEINQLDEKAVYVLVSGITNMIAGIISAITSQPAIRYVPPVEQRKNIAKAFVRAFPTIQMNPKTTLVLTVLMAYAPIIVLAISDYKQKQNATTTIDNNIRNERDWEIHISEKDNRANTSQEKTDNLT